MARSRYGAVVTCTGCLGRTSYTDLSSLARKESGLCKECWAVDQAATEDRLSCTTCEAGKVIDDLEPQCKRCRIGNRDAGQSEPMLGGPREPEEQQPL